MADLVVRGATVIDGTGAPGRTADVTVTAGRIEDIGMERRVGQGDHPHPARVCGGDVVQTLDRAAVGLVAPAVGDRPDTIDAE